MGCNTSVPTFYERQIDDRGRLCYKKLETITVYATRKIVLEPTFHYETQYKLEDRRNVGQKIWITRRKRKRCKIWFKTGKRILFDDAYILVDKRCKNLYCTAGDGYFVKLC